jgi:WD40 repeat protein/tRNA A-37 threonylcarbamoyl transferase component Bud32
MPSRSTCVGEEDLQAFLLGDLAEEQARAVALHLEVCPLCEAAASRLDGLADPLLLSLRRILRPPAPESANGTPSAETVDDTGSPAASAGSAPRRVAGYEVLEELGRGGMSVVYKARQATPARLVALKMILGGIHASADRRQRFRDEADTIARLQHPNIVQLFQADFEDEVPFFSLELVEGGSLHARLARQPQPPRQAAGLVRTLARAVHHAHERKIVHRDLKPGNVLLLEAANPLDQCTPKITDFGLARLLEGKEERTQTGDVLGTPEYMAPEQAEGKANKAEPPADVYALGAILYECLTGRPPFQGPTILETLEQVKTQEPLSPNQLQPKVPRDLNTICLKCLHKDPARRYASAAELADDLDRFLDNRPILARPVGLVERGQRWCRRNPGWAAALLLLVVVAVGSPAATWRLYAMNKGLAKAERDTEENLLVSLLAQARGNQTSARVGQRFESLDALKQAARVARQLGKDEKVMLALRNQAIACMPLADIRTLQNWEGNPQGTNGLGFDANFKRYAQSSAEGVSIRRLSDHREVLHLDLPAEARGAAWIRFHFSPSGRFLAAEHSMPGPRRLHVWDLKAKPVPASWTSDEVSAPADFSPDDRTLAVVCRGDSIRLYDPSSGKEVRRLADKVPAARLLFHPDGRSIAVACTKEPVVQVRAVGSGKILRTLRHESEVQAMAWRPLSGAGGLLPVLAVGCYDQRIYLWEDQDGQPPRFLEGHGWDLMDLTFDATGHRLLSAGWDLTLRLWDVPTRRHLLTVPNVRVVGFGTEGSLRAACLEGTRVKILHVAESGVHKVLHGERHRVFRVKFHPVRDWLASTGMEGNVRLWDVGRGLELVHFPPPRGWSILWESSGKGMLMNWPGGIWRWPIHVRPGEGGRQTAVIGPPSLLGNFFREHLAWCGPGDRLLATSGTGTEVTVFRIEGRLEKQLSLPEKNVTVLSGSPDGTWLATSTFDEARGFTVWDLRTGKPAKFWPWGDAEVAFSPDGRWFVATTGRLAPGGAAVHSWEVGTWKEGNHAPLNRSTSAAAILAFAPDSRLLAVTSTMNEIRLLNPDTFEEIAALVAPETELISNLGFSRDGSWLAVAAGKSIHVWDLRAVRQRLRELDLDWDGPDYPDRPESPAWRIKVDPG